MLMIFFATGHNLELAPNGVRSLTWERIANIFDQLDAMHLQAAARVYASPNNHLIFAFYSGLPVQSIGPVRKSFLDTYRGDVVFIDTNVLPDNRVFIPEHVRDEAVKSGQNLSPDAVEWWCGLLRTRSYRELMLKAFDQSESAQLEPLPPFAERSLLEYRQQMAPGPLDLFPMFRGFDIRNWWDWHSVFQYRFVNPVARRGSHANYTERLRGSTALVLLTADAVLYRSSWHPTGTAGAFTFHLLPDPDAFGTEASRLMNRNRADRLAHPE
jgi:hypothetical protein